ncbi:bifunctional phosphopantothenoylcysteine decarboxylase/phosphopantothenate--cysteine ligase CoaBC [Microbacterium barkeri]|uniref:bifunctional phosphopantothenoylcysteine decarboxylase/phosphopantothenate--cysteine ligase CoaBC n=1 Tax=Microbacterium barkeri TaxID=33917 RepID=UPI0024AFE2FF|nr:bifunctional phosphopantothenoylcysteine decarboxylase/phosphopantothenate--cysteine ligase CoaBC [Microbacterium barkeri]MDI6944649.1 bifunctional phosphopantothenoylcysteine decarboxylase/phosphopantothenate--cysteine ligase CoaBC [Microbacterium barkeri]
MNIVVGVSGGIAAYKAVHLVRLLVKDGHDVHVVPTADALRFVGLPTWEAISRHPVTTSVHEDVASVRHVALGQAADLVVVAPATANTLARMAAGIADDLLGTTLLATTAPVVVAPAMHTEMWRHPATEANVDTLRRRGVLFVGPESGQLTGDDVGPGRMAEPERIHEALRAILSRRQDAAGLRIAVSAGGTREPIDPVRFLGNRSSGRQGAAIAIAAADRGAEVTAVLAHVDESVRSALEGHPGIRVRIAGTAAELAGEMREVAPGVDVVIMAAAVADYRVASVFESKLTKEAAGGVPPTLELVENEDILAGLAADRRPGQTVVGFAAETPAEGETLLERGVRKRRRKGVDLLAVNAVGWSEGFEQADNALTIIDAQDQVAASVTGSKREVADALIDAILAVRS